jgi:hypothetical protein
MSSFTNVLSADDLLTIHQLPEVLAAKAKVDASEAGMIYFSIELTDSMRAALQERFGLDLSSVSSIPMRWMKGDTAPHIDRAASASTFEHTYLVYLNDSAGHFVLGDTSYPIAENAGYVFSEGLSHETVGTGNTPRLLMGPMNELAQPVGSPLSYYPTEADALAYSNALGYSGSFTVGDGGPFGPGGGYTHWRLASNSYGTSSQAIVYTNGNVLNNDGGYFLYPANPCFLAGSKILCQVDGVEKYVPVEELQRGTLVKTSLDGFKAVAEIGTGTLQNPGDDVRSENRLYKCSPAKYSALTEDLYITGCHSILEFPITDAQKEETVKRLGKLFVTDKKFRLMACIDERAEPWNSAGTYQIYHFALEHADDGMNYGVYANGGLLVETCSLRSLKHRSNLSLL